MYPIEFDLKKGTVFIPKETVEAIGSPSDVSFLYRKEDTSLLLVAGDLSSYSHKDHMRRPKSPKSGSLSRCWDEEANGYRIKGYLPTLSRIAWKFPGADGGLARLVFRPVPPTGRRTCGQCDPDADQCRKRAIARRAQASGTPRPALPSPQRVRVNPPNKK